MSERQPQLPRPCGRVSSADAFVTAFTAAPPHSQRMAQPCDGTDAAPRACSAEEFVESTVLPATMIAEGWAMQLHGGDIPDSDIGQGTYQSFDRTFRRINWLVTSLKFREQL